MNDRFNMNFPSDKHEVYEWLMKQPNKSGLIIAALEKLMAVPEASAEEGSEPDKEKIQRLFALTFGDVETDYHGERNFISFSSRSAVINRINSLRIRHPKETDAVIDELQKKYPSIYRLAFPTV